MEDFSASLVREKIVFIDESKAAPQEGMPVEPTVIRSNRMFLRLTAGGVTEKLVIRGHTMHNTLLLAAKAVFSFYKNGLFLARASPYDWQEVWESTVSDYERETNPDLWAAVYINGKAEFRTAVFPFVDVIEKCALLTIDNYDATMDVTETALRQLGKAMSISHTSNVAAIFNDHPPSMRCGIIHRTNNKDHTFSFTATGGETESRVLQGLNIAAVYLEALNLRYMTRSLKARIRKGEVTKFSPEAARVRTATTRLTALSKLIDAFEQHYEVKYRPEKPDFFGTNF